jgi:hypothetical protein
MSAGSGRTPFLTNHEVLFLDFLGFAASVQNWDDEQMGRLIEILLAISNAQSKFDIRGGVQSDGGYKINSRPEITTFSDHIVVSYPEIAKTPEIPDEIWHVMSDGWAGMVREQMQKITAQVAFAALEIGLLVRGGLSRGKLYHGSRVVVGEAMVEAHRIESKVADVARVVASPTIGDNDRLFTDTDGERCLDYMTELMLLAQDRRSDARVWAINTLAQIGATITGLESKGLTKEATKWIYFRDKLSHAAETWN